MASKPTITVHVPDLTLRATERLMASLPGGMVKGDYGDLYDRGRLTRRTLPDGSVIYQVEKMAQVETFIKAIDTEQRIVEVIGSTDQEDHFGDTVAVDGWDVKTAFKANPVVLLDHRYTVASIAGRTLKTWVDGHSFMFQDKFDPAGTNEAADMAFAKIVNQSLRTTSVGFIPLVWESRKDEDGSFLGIDFAEQLLLEKSWVAVPANPGAVISNSATDANASRHSVPPGSPGQPVSLDAAERLLRKATIASMNAKLSRRTARGPDRTVGQKAGPDPGGAV